LRSNLKQKKKGLAVESRKVECLPRAQGPELAVPQHHTNFTVHILGQINYRCNICL
jgi:hypothetical protein